MTQQPLALMEGYREMEHQARGVVDGLQVLQVIKEEEGQLWALAKCANAPMITREAITKRMSTGCQRLENF